MYSKNKVFCIKGITIYVYLFTFYSNVQHIFINEVNMNGLYILLVFTNGHYYIIFVFFSF